MTTSMLLQPMQGRQPYIYGEHTVESQSTGGAGLKLKLSLEQRLLVATGASFGTGCLRESCTVGCGSSCRNSTGR